MEPGCARAIHPRTLFKVDQRKAGNEDHSRKNDQRPVRRTATLRHCTHGLRRIAVREGCKCGCIWAGTVDPEEHGQRHHTGSTLHHCAAGMRPIEVLSPKNLCLPKWRRINLNLTNNHHERLGHIDSFVDQWNSLRNFTARGLVHPANRNAVTRRWSPKSRRLPGWRHGLSELLRARNGRLFVPVHLPEGHCHPDRWHLLGTEPDGNPLISAGQKNVANA
ncbi:hypothetical protein SAMN05660489_02436 [Pseudomonas sp. LAMO17WK12:I10]|nr:hypothetical protein H160_02521 [Pseudomonas sp. LAMO17WK12:I9]SNY29308.1 hypothetical protein SAMN05660489_02436 [Pseudomonas sp. LAMO17WK12:I10]